MYKWPQNGKANKVFSGYFPVAPGRGGVLIVGRAGMFHSSNIMNEAINWPRGEFTIEEAVGLNPACPPAAVRKKLSDAIAAKAVVQTQKGNGKIKGKFSLAAPAN